VCSTTGLVLYATAEALSWLASAADAGPMLAQQDKQSNMHKYRKEETDR
jgi:hypothetical protein